LDITTERSLVRELAKQYAEIAAHPANAERKARIIDNNSLVPGRPIVWIDEVPWFEMDFDGSLAPRCERPEFAEIERFFRVMLFRWKHMQADMVAEDTYYIGKAFERTGIGVSVREDTSSTDDKNWIVSHHYDDQLDTEEKVERLGLPVVTVRPDIDAKKLEFAREVIGDIIPVELRGHMIYYSPWDEISTLRGVTAILTDMAERPELMHRTIQKFTEYHTSLCEQMLEQGLLAHNLSSLHCTPAYTRELPAADYDGGNLRFKDIWFRGMAQIFSSVSPAMHEEFDLQYMRPMMERCGLAYYGCCEALDNKISLLKKTPNMRKIGVSPWADVRKCAEQMGGGYVFARKPNPAMVMGDFDEEAVRRETRETVEACLENKCPYELVLKDISTVSYRAENLFKWNKAVQETIDEYY